MNDMRSVAAVGPPSLTIFYKMVGAGPALVATFVMQPDITRLQKIKSLTIFCKMVGTGPALVATFV